MGRQAAKNDLQPSWHRAEHNSAVIARSTNLTALHSHAKSGAKEECYKWTSSSGSQHTQGSAVIMAAGACLLLKANRDSMK